MTAGISYEGVRLGTEDGRGVAVPPDGTITAAGPTSIGTDTVRLGGLDVQPRSGTTAVFDSLEIGHAHDEGLIDWPDDIGWLPGAALLVGVPAVAAGDDPDLACTRRELIAAAGVLTGATALADPASAAEEGERVSAASFELVANPDGVRFAINGAVQGVLPDDQEYTLLIDGDIEDSFTPGEGTAVPPEKTGSGEIRTTASVSLFRRVISNIWRTEYSWRFELDEPLSAADEDTNVVITADPMIVETAAKKGPSQTILTVGGVSLPHHTERGNFQAGTYRFLEKGDDGRQLVIDPGPDAPNSQIARLRTGVGRFDEALDDIGRELP